MVMSVYSDFMKLDYVYKKNTFESIDPNDKDHYVPLASTYIGNAASATIHDTEGSIRNDDSYKIFLSIAENLLVEFNGVK